MSPSADKRRSRAGRFKGKLKPGDSRYRNDGGIRGINADRSRPFLDSAVNRWLSTFAPGRVILSDPSYSALLAAVVAAIHKACPLIELTQARTKGPEHRRITASIWRSKMAVIRGQGGQFVLRRLWSGEPRDPARALREALQRDKRRSGVEARRAGRQLAKALEKRSGGATGGPTRCRRAAFTRCF
jgi:hypothetical protein